MISISISSDFGEVQSTSPEDSFRSLIIIGVIAPKRI